MATVTGRKCNIINKHRPWDGVTAPAPLSPPEGIPLFPRIFVEHFIGSSPGVRRGSKQHSRLNVEMPRQRAYVIYRQSTFTTQQFRSYRPVAAQNPREIGGGHFVCSSKNLSVSKGVLLSHFSRTRSYASMNELTASR
jgi:hypothetical protein